MSRIFYPRIAVSFIAMFLLMLFTLFLLAWLGFIGLAFRRLGFSPLHSILILFLSLAGSTVNIPVREVVSREPVITGRVVDFYGFRYVIPSIEVGRRTLIAVNLGGAIIPVLISGFLLMKANLLHALIGIVIMTFFINRLAKPVKGLGIAVPALIPPILAAILALIISPGEAPIIAYISGTLGSLIGADLLNMKKIPELGAPIASIGGAGTFDGIFLIGIISVLLA